jgi:stage II sporulation protein AB (anti-sigma F factor)
MNLKFSALSENESFARLTVASFCANKIKDIEVISDIKTAVSEAVTNSIVHGYEDKQGNIEIRCVLDEERIVIEIIDQGIGIKDVEEARKPFFTSKPDKERSGMGFTVMEGFVDKMIVESEFGKGTKVVLIKSIQKIA